MTTSARAFQLPRVPPRHCRWCEKPIVHGRKDRGWHDGREDEEDCSYAYQLHTRREVQFKFVVERDGKKCWDCGTTPGRWHRGGTVFLGGSRDFVDRQGVIWAAGSRYSAVEYVTALELEHTVPLWRTTHLIWADRRGYFGPGNLRLRCPGCHAPKTSHEATLRAKEKRQAKLRVGAERREPKRKIQSRGFDQGHRPMASRPFPNRRKP